MKFVFIKKIILSTFLVVSIFKIQAQEQKSLFWSNVHIGGGIGLSFGSNFFSGSIAPSAIYDLNEKFSVGISLNGTYSSEKNVYKAYIVGGSILGLFNPLPQLQLSVEFEELHVTRQFENRLFIEDDNYWTPALFIGAGYRNGNFTIGVRYNVLFNEEDNVYGVAFAPFVRVYF